MKKFVIMTLVVATIAGVLSLVLRPANAQFEPCVWPNCSQQIESDNIVLATKFEPCVWPNTCG